MDIIERLRDLNKFGVRDLRDFVAYSQEAVNEIERLRKADLKAAVENEQLREALRFYAEWGIDAPAVDAIIEEDRGDKARAALNIVLADLENGD